MLVLYSGMLFYPIGDPASNYTVGVFPLGSNQAANLFNDQAGTSPKANPITTDGNGEFSFYAPPARYVLPFAGEMVPVEIDAGYTDPVWPDLWVHTQASAVTVWNIAHWFGVRPDVEVVVTGEVVTVEVDHTDANHVTITFTTPQSGAAYLRR